MLFKDNKKINDYASFQGLVDYNAVKSTIRIVELRYVIPIIGKELYNALDTALALITNEDGLSVAHKLLLHQCRMVIGPYLCYHYTPKAGINLTASSANRSETESSKTAFQYQTTNFKEEQLREAEVASELLLEFLELNKTSYTEWVTSKAFAQYKSLFIQTAFEFNDLYKTATPFRNYWAMRSKMVDVEELYVRKIIGDAFFDSLKQKAAENSYTSKELRLLFMLKKVTAYFTVAFSLPHLSVRIDAGGITVADIATSSNDKDSRKDADGTKIELIVDSCKNSATEWINKVKEYCIANKADFVLYPINAADTSSSSGGNESLKSVFGMF